MASAATGSFGGRRAHDGEQRRRRRRGAARPAWRRTAAAKLSKSCVCGSGEPSSSARFASTSSRARPGGSAVGDGRQRDRELPLDVAVLLRIGGQLTLGEGAGFPATVKGVCKQVTPDNRLRKHLVHRLRVHRRTLSAPRLTSTGPARGPGAATIRVCSPWCGSLWVGSSAGAQRTGARPCSGPGPSSSASRSWSPRRRCRWWRPGG